jgi:hypothetical protein
VITPVCVPSELATAARPSRPLPLSPGAGRWNSRPLPFSARASLAIEVLVAYVAVRWSVSRTELPSVVGALRSCQGPEGDQSDGASVLHHQLSLRLGYIVEALLRRAPGDGPCLVRSLVLTRLLARRQIPARLVIGVQSEPSFSAHAWVEHRGQPLLPTDIAHQRLVEL